MRDFLKKSMKYYLILDKFLKPKKAATIAKIVIPPSIGTHGGGQQGGWGGPPCANVMYGTKHNEAINMYLFIQWSKLCFYLFYSNI